MKYREFDSKYIEIIPDGIKPEEFLNEIARQSYATSIYRSRHLLRREEWTTFPPGRGPDEVDLSWLLLYEKLFIRTRSRKGAIVLEEKRGDLAGLDLGIPYGRDCRTTVMRQNGLWLFDADEYSYSMALDGEGRLVGRDPGRLLDAVGRRFNL